MSNEQRRRLLDLPAETLHEILRYLRAETPSILPSDLCRVSLTCKRLSYLAQEHLYHRYHAELETSEGTYVANMLLVWYIYFSKPPLEPLRF